MGRNKKQPTADNLSRTEEEGAEDDDEYEEENQEDKQSPAIDPKEDEKLETEKASQPKKHRGRPPLIDQNTPDETKMGSGYEILLTIMEEVSKSPKLRSVIRNFQKFPPHDLKALWESLNLGDIPFKDRMLIVKNWAQHNDYPISKEISILMGEKSADKLLGDDAELNIDKNLKQLYDYQEEQLKIIKEQLNYQKTLETLNQQREQIDSLRGSTLKKKGEDDSETKKLREKIESLEKQMNDNQMKQMEDRLRKENEELRRMIETKMGNNSQFTKRTIKHQKLDSMGKPIPDAYDIEETEIPISMANSMSQQDSFEQALKVISALKGIIGPNSNQEIEKEKIRADVEKEKAKADVEKVKAEKELETARMKSDMEMKQMELKHDMEKKNIETRHETDKLKEEIESIKAGAEVSDERHTQNMNKELITTTQEDFREMLDSTREDSKELFETLADHTLKESQHKRKMEEMEKARLMGMTYEAYLAQREKLEIPEISESELAGQVGTVMVAPDRTVGPAQVLTKKEMSEKTELLSIDDEPEEEIPEGEEQEDEEYDEDEEEEEEEEGEEEQEGSN